MKQILSALLGFSLLLSGCKDSILDPDYTVSGVVTNAGTGLPLDGVTVTLREDREGPFFPGTVLQTATTGPDGRYSFTFTWRDSPYEVYVERPAYRYARAVTNNITSDTLWVNYQSVEFGRHQSQLDFGMELTDHLLVKLKNVTPHDGLDRLNLTLRRTRNGPAVVGPVNEFGLVERDLYLGLHIPGSYVYLDYEVTHLNTTTQHLDSVLIVPHTLVVYELNY